eukprot:6406854-Heterocapsa_arctica.AAC.1
MPRSLDKWDQSSFFNFDCDALFALLPRNKHWGGLGLAKLRAAVACAQDYFCLKPTQLNRRVFEHRPARLRVIKGYMETAKGRCIFDLCQYPCNGRGRTELKYGSMITLTTSSQGIYSKKHKRCLQATELLAVQNLPATNAWAKAAKCQELKVPDDVCDSAITKMAGNGMHVGAVGAVALIAALFVKVSN